MMMINELGLYKRLMTAAVLLCALTGALGVVAEDAYIESYGTGSICLGHFAGPNTKIEVDMEMKELVNGTRLFGGYGNHSSSLSFFLYFGTISSTDTRIRYSWDTSDIDGKRMAWNMDVASVGERRTISFDAPTRTYTSIPHGATTGTTHVFTKAVLNKTSPYPLAVFGSSTDRTYGASTNDFTVKAWPVRMKCYGVKIYESGALVKNFVPCVKGGIAGLKETINNRFMSSVNVKAVGYGGDILEEKDDPYVATFSNTNSLYLANTRLAGKSIYFSTGYYMKPTSKLELDYALLTPDWTPDKLHGSMLNLIAGGSSSKKMYVDVYGSDATRGNFYISLNGSESAPDIRVETACDGRRTVTITSNSYAFVTAGYTNVAWTTTGGIKENQNYWGIKLACNQSYDGGFTPMKIYGLKIYESGALIKDFRPFVTNGVAGLIDRLDTSKKLFPITYCSNNKTNVVAEAGGDLEREGYTAASESEAYLVFDGVSGHNINTGYVITPNSCIEADFSVYDTSYNGQQGYFKQDAGTGCILARLYMNSAYTLSYQFEDWAGNTTGVNTGISAASNERRQFKLDGHNNHVTIKRGDEVLYSADMTKTHNYTGTTKKMIIGDTKACMKLYGFKISESGTETRNFVPCVTNGVAGLYELHTKAFFPLKGGKVIGKGTKDVSNFVAVPQSATLTKDGDGNTATLTCLAPSAQSYEWYEDGVRMPGETSDSLTLNWERAKAKPNNHTHTYSVKPVYTVFNEKVLGDAATATVEYTPQGMVISIQ